MFRRENQKRSAVKCIGTCCENADPFVAVIDFKIDLRAFAPTDPISLEQLDSFRPIQSVQLIQ